MGTGLLPAALGSRFDETSSPLLIVERCPAGASVADCFALPPPSRLVLHEQPGAISLCDPSVRSELLSGNISGAHVVFIPLERVAWQRVVLGVGSDAPGDALNFLDMDGHAGDRTTRQAAATAAPPAIALAPVPAQKFTPSRHLLASGLFSPDGPCAAEVGAFAACIHAAKSVARCHAAQRAYMRCQRVSTLGTPDLVVAMGEGGGDESSVAPLAPLPKKLSDAEAALVAAPRFVGAGSAAVTAASAAGRLGVSAGAVQALCAALGSGDCPVPMAEPPPLPIPSSGAHPGPGGGHVLGPDLSSAAGLVIGAILSGIIGPQITEMTQSFASKILAVMPPVLRLVMVDGSDPATSLPTMPSLPDPSELIAAAMAQAEAARASAEAVLAQARAAAEAVANQAREAVAAAQAQARAVAEMQAAIKAAAAENLAAAKAAAAQAREDASAAAAKASEAASAAAARQATSDALASAAQVAADAKAASAQAASDALATATQAAAAAKAAAMAAAADAQAAVGDAVAATKAAAAKAAADAKAAAAEAAAHAKSSADAAAASAKAAALQAAAEIKDLAVHGASSVLTAAGKAGAFGSALSVAAVAASAAEAKASAAVAAAINDAKSALSAAGLSAAVAEELTAADAGSLLRDAAALRVAAGVAGAPGAPSTQELLHRHLPAARAQLVAGATAARRSLGDVSRAMAALRGAVDAAGQSQIQAERLQAEAAALREALADEEDGERTRARRQAVLDRAAAQREWSRRAAAEPLPPQKAMPAAAFLERSSGADVRVGASADASADAANGAGVGTGTGAGSSGAPKGRKGALAASLYGDLVHALTTSLTRAGTERLADGLIPGLHDALAAHMGPQLAAGLPARVGNAVHEAAARAVLAAQRVDLARAQVKAHLAQRGDAGEALRDGTGFEQGGHYF